MYLDLGIKDVLSYHKVAYTVCYDAIRLKIACNVLVQMHLSRSDSQISKMFFEIKFTIIHTLFV